MVVTLQSPEGKVLKVKCGLEVKNLNEVNVGDSVLVRLTRAVSTEVSKLELPVPNSEAGAWEPAKVNDFI